MAFVEIQGTVAAIDAPLASTGMDSIAMTELATTLAQQVEIELPQTLFFDHPTIGAVAAYVATSAPSEVRAVTAAVERRVVGPPVARHAIAATEPVRDTMRLVLFS